MRRPSLRTITITLAALALPATLLISTLVTAYYKNNNPDNVDITQSLAYLTQGIVSGIIVFTLFAAGVVVGIVKMYKRDNNFVEAKLPMVLLLLVIVLISGAAIANSYTSKVEDQYLLDNGRPTLQQFFDAQKKQEKR